MLKNIVLEGYNGTGKDTVEKLLLEFISNGGYTNNVFREPNDINNIKIRENVRRYYNQDELTYFKDTGRDYNVSEINHLSRLFLFMASRANNVHLITNNDNHFNIINRFTPSTLVYNSLELNKDINELYELERMARNDFVPDIVYYLYLEPNMIYHRILNRERDYLKSKYNLEGYSNFISRFNDLYPMDITLSNINLYLNKYNDVNDFLISKRWNIKYINNISSYDTTYKIYEDII